MLAEYVALLKNNTLILTTLPPGKNLVGCTWIFKLKLHLSREIARHKAKLVAQGFSQQPGFDFTETFSPVVNPATIRMILTIVVSFGWEITHLDVNNAFLNGELKEDIYMRHPQSIEQGGPHLVCKLKKAIYGLKQASRAWFFTIHSVLISLGFKQSRADASMFVRRSASLRLRGDVRGVKNGLIKCDDLIKRVEGDGLINQALLHEKSENVHVRTSHESAIRPQVQT
ncbi:hypothetical protein SASPL_123885 [Salvia splendens]|uniref:Reverse transcriptase Ty1/copia-type domain-containing protein n=1 Tax=Salvia splendens TaxID=180675 RepID=A0A8X8XM87_SALSN|nr:hypothetical protein SASPL_123885 [Salvia splendens]